MDDSVLSIFAHQDDETFSAGGTLNKYTNSYAISVTSDLNRFDEFEQACNMLGVNGRQLSFSQIHPSNQNEIFDQLVNLVREIKPNHIITHIDFDYHHEHRLLRRIVEEAVEWASHTTNQGIQAHQIDSLWAAETTVLIPKPEILIDISKQNEHRMNAIKIYESQSHKGGDGFYSKFHGCRTSLRGIQAGVEHAEAFVQIPILKVGSFKPEKVLQYFPKF